LHVGKCGQLRGCLFKCKIKLAGLFLVISWGRAFLLFSRLSLLVFRVCYWLL
jgi:hypothetical protein